MGYLCFAFLFFSSSSPSSFLFFHSPSFLWVSFYDFLSNSFLHFFFFSSTLMFCYVKSRYLFALQNY
ncbi:hypothetical protein HDV64DRAFT_251893 [Trichoderma sp. TUCIM 5745]